MCKQRVAWCRCTRVARYRIIHGEHTRRYLVCGDDIRDRSGGGSGGASAATAAIISDLGGQPSRHIVAPPV